MGQKVCVDRTSEKELLQTQLMNGGVENLNRHCQRFIRQLRSKASHHISSMFKWALDQRAINEKDLTAMMGSGSIHYFGKAESRVASFPVSRHSRSMHEYTKDKHYPKSFTCELNDIRLVGRYPIAMTDSYRFLINASIKERIFYLNSIASVLSIPNDIKHFIFSEAPSIDCAYLLANYWSKGYFHWYMDSLIQLRGVKEYESETGKRPKIIIPSKPADWQLQSLKLLGYGEDDLFRWSVPKAKVDNLVVVSNQRGRRESIVWLREQLTRHCESTRQNRIFISREDADRRRIINEDELMAKLARYGFEKFVPGIHSLNEQIQTMSNAGIVVGVHGAGLTNILYGPDKLTLLEIHPKNDIRHHYFNLCEMLDFDYSYYASQTSGVDLWVDTTEIEELVVDLLKTSVH